MRYISIWSMWMMLSIDRRHKCYKETTGKLSEMLGCRHQNAGKSHNIKTENKSSENV